jgi:hypothetical protein
MTPGTRVSPGVRFTGGFVLSGWVRSYWQWLPIVPLLIYCVALVAHFRGILHGVYSSADDSSLLNIAQSFGSAPHTAQVVYGDVEILQVLAVLLATRVLPLHRYIWEVAPWLASLAGIGVVARIVGMISGRWAAMVIMVTLGCAAYFLLELEFGWGIHAPAYQDITLFGAVPALLALRGGMLGRSRGAWCFWLLVAVLVGAGGLADDKLFIVGGFVPFVIAGAVTVWLAPSPVRRRALLSTVIIVMGTLIGSVVALAIAHRAGITSIPFQSTFVQYNQILDHGGLLAESLLYLLNGNFAGLTVNATGVVAFLAAAAVVAATAVAYRHGHRQIRELLTLLPVAPRPREPLELARIALTVYWIASAVLLSISFVFTSAVVDVYGMRYVVTVAYAVVILAAVAAAPHVWARNLAALGSYVIVCSASISLVRHDLEVSTAVLPQPTDATALARWADAKHLRYGYASYWDAAPLTWWTQSRPAVYPTLGCGTDLDTLCAYDNRVTSWYTPRPHTRTFVIVDNRFLSSDVGAALDVAGPPKAFGRPASIAHVNDLTIYVYPYDVASRFGPPAGV